MYIYLYSVSYGQWDNAWPCIDDAEYLLVLVANLKCWACFRAMDGARDYQKSLE